MTTFTAGDRVRTNAHYLAAGGPRAVRKPWSGRVVKFDANEHNGEELISVMKDGTHSPQWYKAYWFDKEAQ